MQQSLIENAQKKFCKKVFKIIAIRRNERIRNRRILHNIVKVLKME